MCARWLVDPPPITKTLERIANVAEALPAKDGAIKWKDFRFETYKSILRRGLGLNKEICTLDADRILSLGLYDCLKGGQLDASVLLASVSNREEQFLKANTPRQFVLTSRMSVAYPFLVSELRNGSTRFRFWRKLPRRFERDYADMRFEEETPFDLPKDYIGVGIEVNQRTAVAAADEAIANFAYLRGVLNFVVGRGSTTYKFGGFFFGPLGRIVAGPVHALHQANGAKMSDTFYVEPGYVRSMPLWKCNASQAQRHLKELRLILRRVERATYREKLRQAFARYGEALEEAYADHAFLALWSVLEILTGARPGEHKVAAARASNMWDERDLLLEELYYLRDTRNGMVHSGERSENSQLLANEIKKYVEQLFYTLVQNPFLKMPWSEVVEFLGKSSDVNQLKRQIALLRRAVKFFS